MQSTGLQQDTNIENKLTKIIIVDDHPLLREGIRKILEIEENIRVVGEAEYADDAIKLIIDKNPDLAIIDISLEGSVNGIELVKAIRERFQKVKTLILSMHNESIYIERAIRAGAKGYITKKEGPSIIVEAVKAVMDGEIYLSHKISGKIINKLINGPSDFCESEIDALTSREIEVFQMIGNGFATGEIAKKLNLSVNTIESHRRNIREKLDIKSGSELVKNAVQWVLSQNN